MAEAGVSFLLDNLKLLAVHQYDLYRNAESEFEQLQHELNVMKVFLNHAADNPKEEEHFKAWEKRIKEAVYDAEDTVDSWITEGNTVLSRMNIAKKIRTLRNQKVKPAFDMAKADFSNMPASETLKKGAYAVRDIANKAPKNENVVGFEDEIDKLVKYMYEKEEELDVISIIGMPGLGKTTVAWKVYNHQDIQADFPIRIWVYVSQDLNKKEILLTIMKKFTTEDLSTKGEDELSIMVKDKLATDRFLLVVDDVWTEKAWDDIKSLLPMGNANGKVLITSRDLKVGIKSNNKRKPHELRFLDENESLELLHIEAFGKTIDVPNILVPTCKLIARQCGGLPLAIIVIGGVLVGKRPPGQRDDETETEWKKVSESVRTHLNEGDKEKRMEKFISLSYTTLPYHLRDCFLYLGMFPEDAEIHAWKLRQMWIAEGLILQQKGKSLEEVAHENLKDLIGRNLLQVDTIKPNGEVKNCRLHDTIREFCINEAAVEKQNLFQEIRKSKEGVLEPSIDTAEKCRRLCIHSNVEKILSEYFKKKNGLKVRSLLCFSKDPIVLVNNVITNITNASVMLRVLEMSSTIIVKIFPYKVSQLVHLRYISLSGDEFKILPADISKLWNLQTILVVTMQRTLEVKASLWKMVQLRHFKTKASVTLKHGNGEGGGTLQTLGRLSPKSCTADVFQKAKNLNTLGIRGDLNNVVFDAKSFVSLEKLEKLKLYHDVFPKAADENPWRSFPLADKFPTHLKSLTLKKTYLEWTHMTFMGGLHTLEVLKLEEDAFQGKHWHRANTGGFVRLKFLHIERVDLVVWEAPTGSFPELKSLVIKNCEELQEVPLQVADNLEMMYLERVNKSIATSARKIAATKNAGSRIPVFRLVVKSESE